MQQIMLPDADAEIEPVPTAGGGQRPEPELDRLSNILKAFNDLFGDIAWQDRDRVGDLITKTIPRQVAADVAFRNARQNSDDANARIEHDRVLARIVTGMIKGDAELFKQFMDNEGFKRRMTDRVFELACEQAGRGNRERPKAKKSLTHPRTEGPENHMDSLSVRMLIFAARSCISCLGPVRVPDGTRKCKQD